MKKLVFGGLFLALIGIGLVGCKKTEDPIVSNDFRFVKQIDIMNLDWGDIHNRAMKESVTNYLGSFNSKPNTKKQETNDPNVAYDLLVLSLAKDLSISNSEVEILFEKINLNREKFITNSSDSRSFNEKYSTYFSGNSELFHYLKIIDKETSEMINIDVYIERLSNLKNNGLQNVRNDNKLILDRVLDISIQSAQFWSNDFGDIVNSGPASIDPNSKRIIKADVDGALSGAVGGAMGGAAVAGVGAVPGAILMSGLGASFNSAKEGFWVWMGW